MLVAIQLLLTDWCYWFIDAGNITDFSELLRLKNYLSFEATEVLLCDIEW